VTYSNFKLDIIDDILNKSLQPWNQANIQPDRYYREKLGTTVPIPLPQDVKYQVCIKPHLMFTPRVRYYCRLADNAVASHLREVFGMLDTDGSEHLILYLQKLTRESVTTLVHDAVSHCRRLTLVAEQPTDFIDHREEKEYLVILHYLIASLARCWMEIQERYSYVVDVADRMDVTQFYASVVGWVDMPIVQVETLSKVPNNGNGNSKISTCSFYYINNDEEERNRCLSDFRNRLIHYGLIPATTDLKQLLAVFSGRSTAAVIEWTGKKHVLKFIIAKLLEKRVLSIYPDDKYSQWYVVSCRFRYNGGQMPNISSESSRKKDEAMIDDIIGTLV
jgi:hypothetical protein